MLSEFGQFKNLNSYPLDDISVTFKNIRRNIVSILSFFFYSLNKSYNVINVYKVQVIFYVLGYNDELRQKYS